MHARDLLHPQQLPVLLRARKNEKQCSASEKRIRKGVLQPPAARRNPERAQ